MKIQSEPAAMSPSSMAGMNAGEVAVKIQIGGRCNDGDIGGDGKMSWYMLVETAASHAKEVREIHWAVIMLRRRFPQNHTSTISSSSKN
ncbi:uncharacterized protein G2W53_012988 [Senna tora]|uniref:Uncharacterized protein n=1 Tax=Senna tora TaxID=362788 RepID=A0A834TXZ6_9FABA|nr:uncharacterized protein G2W53_012988 [Senna tora]